MLVATLVVAVVTASGALLAAVLALTACRGACAAEGAVPLLPVAADARTSAQAARPAPGTAAGTGVAAGPGATGGSAPGPTLQTGVQVGSAVGAGIAGESAPRDPSDPAVAVAPAPRTAERAVPGQALAGRVAAAARVAGSARVRVEGEGPRRLRGGGWVRYGPRAVDLAATLTLRGRTVRAVLTPQHLYFAPPQALAGTSWIRIPRGAGMPLTQEWADLTGGLPGVAEPWAGSWDDVDAADRGEQRLAGVPAQHYELQLGAVDPRGAGPLPGSLHAALGARGRVVSETVQVWLDEADQPLRVVSTLRTTGTTTRATLAFDAWGEQARIDVPTGSQVLDAETTTS